MIPQDNKDASLVNRVSQSGLVTLDLEQYFPKGNIISFDLTPYLFMGLILKEKDFRERLEELDWNQFAGQHLAVYCSADAIIPMWAYMLVASKAAPYVAGTIQCTPEQYADLHFLKTIAALPIAQYADKRVVIKGCSDKPVPPMAYFEITRLLTPTVRSMMFGEPCSTVPVFKKSLKEG
jgi:hypothetical protein